MIFFFQFFQISFMMKVSWIPTIRKYLCTISAYLRTICIWVSKLLCYLIFQCLKNLLAICTLTYVHVKSQFSTLRKHEYLMIKSKDFPTTKCNIVSRRQLRKSKLQFLAVSVKWKKKLIVKSIGNPIYIGAIHDNLKSLIDAAADWHEPLYDNLH